LYLTILSAHSEYHTSACIQFYVTLYRSGLSHGKLIASTYYRYPPRVCISNLLSDPITYVNVNIGIQVDNKRDPVFYDQNKWVDTEPKCIIDFGGEESTILKYEFKKLLEKNASMLSEIAILQNNAKERDQHIARLESAIAILRKEDQEKDLHIARLESAIYKLREEIMKKSADKHAESAVMHPFTPPPTVNKEVPQPTSNKKPKDYTSNTSMSPK